MQAWDAVGSRGSQPPDAGVAPVEFVLVSALLTALFLGLVQLGIALHVRNVLASAAAEGARYGANADFAGDSAHAGAAAQRTREVISQELSPAYAGNVGARVTADGGVDVVEVDVDTAIPVVGMWVSVPRHLSVVGHALVEGG